MSPYNPHTPDTLGCEWFPTVKASDVLASSTFAASQRWTQVGDDDVDEFAFFVPNVAGLDDQNGSGWELEVYDVASWGVFKTTVATFNPGEDVLNLAGDSAAPRGFAFGPFAPAGTGVNIYRGIDSYPGALFPGKGSNPNNGAPIDNDEAVLPIFGTGLECTFRFVGVAGALTGKRIVRVTLNAWVQTYVAYSQPANMGIMPNLRLGNVRYSGEKRSVQGQAPGGKLVSFDWFANPRTGVSWKPQDIDELSAGTGTDSAGWVVDSTPNANVTTMILQAWLEVEYTQDVLDPRVAVGPLTAPVLGWNRITLTAPDGTPAFHRVDGTTYQWALRRRTGVGRIGARWLDSRSAPPGDIVAHAPTFTTGLTLAGLGEPLSRLWASAWVPLGDHSTIAAHSTPYASISNDVEAALGIHDVWVPVDTAHPLSQEIEPAASIAYGWVRVLARLVDETVLDDLTVTLLDSSSVPQGTPLVISPGDLTAPRTAWQIVEGPTGGAVLDGSAVNTVVLTSPAANALGWEVQVLSTFMLGGLADPPNDIGAGTFGGTTLEAIVDLTRRAELDLAVTVSTQPDAPAGFAAGVITGDACVDDVSLTWEPTTVVDGGGFYRYEIERSDTRTGWKRIAEITHESVDEFIDHEARAETVTTYRLRVRRVDQSASDWTESGDVTPAMPCCGFALSTNTDPTLVLWADDIGAKRSIDWTAQTVVTREFYGRDYQVAFHSLEWVGDVFDLVLVLAGKGMHDGTPETSTPGRRTFDPLLDFLPSKGAGLPYVCLRNSNGDRWFCSIQIKSGDQDEPSSTYTAIVHVVEVADTPVPVDVDAGS